MHGKIVQMNLFQQVTLPIKQVFKVVSKSSRTVNYLINVYS